MTEITPDEKPAPHDAFGALSALSPTWSIVARLTQIRIMFWLWIIAAVLDLAISMAWNWTWATPLRVAATYSCGFGLSFVGYRLAPRVNASPTDFSVPGMLAVVLPSGMALFVIDVIGRAYAHGESPFVTWPDMYIRRTRINLAYFTMMFAFQFTIAWLSASARALEARERQLLEARIAALRLQLNPHFLFNTLNAILTLVEEAGAKDAERMLTRLSDFLQVALQTEPTVMVPLASEIDMAQAYLDIEAVRFGDRLQVEYDCEAGLDDAEVPNFILQPLVENSVKHGVAPVKEPVTVSIGARDVGGDLQLWVTDRGPRRPQRDDIAGNGVGLRNVSARLKALYGDAASVDARREETGFTVTVTMPLVRDRQDTRQAADEADAMNRRPGTADVAGR